MRAAGREPYVAIVGQTGGGRRELSNPESCLDRFRSLLPGALRREARSPGPSLVNHEHVPPAVYSEHVVLDHRNVGRYYASPA